MYTGKSRWWSRVLYALELFKSSSDEEPKLGALCHAGIQECRGGEERIHSWEKALQVKICNNQKTLTFLYHIQYRSECIPLLKAVCIIRKKRVAGSWSRGLSVDICDQLYTENIAGPLHRLHVLIEPLTRL